jgi:hypothetical protein
MDSVPFYRRPWFWTVAGMALWIAGYAWTVYVSAPEDLTGTLAVDLGLALLAFLVMTSLAAQFVLPVRTWRDRRIVVGRLLQYIAGQHGPVLFVENGKAVEGGGEGSRTGAGVLLVDQASAAVLRTETRFTRAVGPGVTFTDLGEGLAEALDVRRQVRVLPGRLPGAEGSPPPQSVSSQALTQDGIPVSADLSVTFMLDPGHTLAPREGRSPHLPPYEFNPAAAERAVFGHAYGEHGDSPWTDLPLRLVIDLFREQVKQRRLEELFASPASTPSPLTSIQEAILARLTQPAPAPHEPGTRRDTEAGREVQILSSRGVRVLAVGVSNLRLPGQVQAERMLHWREAWASAIDGALRSAERNVEEARRSGEVQAWKLLAGDVTEALRARLADGAPPNQGETLALILSEAARICAQPPAVADGPALAERLRGIVAAIAGPESPCPDLSTGGPP